jgi:hypothetical protein
MSLLRIFAVAMVIAAPHIVQAQSPTAFDGTYPRGGDVGYLSSSRTLRTAATMARIHRREAMRR